MLRSRSIVLAFVAVALLAVGTFGLTECAPDPLDDYQALRDRAEAEGPMRAAVRGHVVGVRDDLFRIESEALLFPQHLWVLSRSNRDVSVGERVAVQGLLVVRPDQAVDVAGALPDDIGSEISSEGLLVAETVTIYRGQMHGVQG